MPLTPTGSARFGSASAGRLRRGGRSGGRSRRGGGLRRGGGRLRRGSGGLRRGGGRLRRGGGRRLAGTGGARGPALGRVHRAPEGVTAAAVSRLGGGGGSV